MIKQSLLLTAAISGGALLSGQTPKPLSEFNDLKGLSLEELTQVEVTSVSRRPEKLIGTASAIQVISGDAIRRSGFTNLADSLRLADNLNVAQKDPHDWAISARGFNSNLGDKLLVLIDGRTVYTPLFSGVFWNAQDYLLEDVDQIEVISGPGGTLWGANAVNGVINIITKSAKDTLGYYSEAAFGSELRGMGGVRYGGKLAPNVFFRSYLKYSNYDDARLPSGDSASDAWHQIQGGFRLDADVGADNAFSLHGDYYSGDLDIQSGGTARLAGGNVVGHWSHLFADGGEVSLQLYYDHTYLRDPFPSSPFAPAGKLIDSLDTFDLDFQHRFTVGWRNSIVWGLGYRLTDDNVKQQAPNFGFFPARLKQDRYSLFLQDETALTDRVFVTVGSKFEHNDYTGWETEPNLRLRWQITETNNVWTAISRAVRMPSRLDRNLAEPIPPKTLIRGGDDFVSEKLIAYEVGYRSQLSQRASASVALFYNQYDDLRSLSLTPITVLPLTYKNGLEGHTYGLEFSGDYRVTGWWRLHGGFNLLKERIRIRPGHTDLFNGLDETADPEQQISLRSSMDLSRNVELDILYRWVDQLPVNQGGRVATVPSYSELNVRLAWQIKPSLELSLVGQNLLDRQHPEFGPPSNAREELQRNIFGKIAWSF